MDHAVARYDRAVTDLDPSGEQGSTGDYCSVANPAIVGYVRILHEEISATDGSDITLLAAAVDGNAFAKDVAISDDHAAPPAGISDILRLIADDNIRMQDIPRP